jgi:hypothetical protein
MINEVELDYALDQTADLKTLESGIMLTEQSIKTAKALMAIALGQIKLRELYKEVAPSFRQYLMMERTDLPLKTAEYLSGIGVQFWLYRDKLRENKIRLSTVMSKIPAVTNILAEQDPMIWKKLKSLSKREFLSYAERQTKYLNGQAVIEGNIEIAEAVTVSGASLSIGGKKIKGFNLNDARREIAAGKRALIIWIDDDHNKTRRVKRALDKAGIEI